MHINGNTPLWLADIRRANGDARAMVELLFLNALLTLRALPDTDLRHFHVATWWPLCPRDGWFAYDADAIEEEELGACGRFVPSPADHDRMLEVLAWGAGLDDRQWRIVRDRAAGYSVATIADRAHMPPAAVATRYAEALDVVVRAALLERP